MVEKIDGVVVVGAGPVGLMVALKLAQDGVHVVVVERELRIVDAPKAIVTHMPTIEVLESIGLLDDMVSAGIKKYDYQFRNARGEILVRMDTSVLRPSDTRHPYNLHMGQHVFTNIILRHLLRLPSAQVRWGWKVTAATQKCGHAILEIDTPAGRQEIRTPWLVASDGARSAVRRALGIAFEGTTWPEWFVATDIHYDFASYGFANSTLITDPDHFGIVLVIDKTGLWRLTYPENGEFSPAGVRQHMPERFAYLLPGHDAVEPFAFSPYRVHDRCVDNFRVGRVLFAGDAAHATNPVGALGLTSGLFDAFALGDVLGDVVHGRCGDDVLDNYATERRRVFRDVVSPAARENRRRLVERDPERRREDAAKLKRANDDRDLARQVLLGPYRVIGRNVRRAAARGGLFN